MRLLDRYILRRFLLAYTGCFFTLLALYMVIDLFAKLDEFTELESEPLSVAKNVAVYYAYRLPWFFQRLSAIISLMSAMATLAWLQRQNELMPFLAAGVPVRRLLVPLLAGVLVVAGIGLINREWLIPVCGEQLERSATDPRGEATVCAGGCYDDNGIHFEGKVAYPGRQLVQYGGVTIPARFLGRLVHVSCKEMSYRPGNGRDGPGWYLRGAEPAELDCRHPIINNLKQPGVYFVHTDLSFERLTRSPSWFYYQSTRELFHLLREEQLVRRAEVIALLHQRLTTPILELILVLMGIPMILARPERSIFLKLGVGLLIYAAFFGVQYCCWQLAQREYVDAALSAWLPVFLFGPPALVLLDAIKS
jgi:lipopolysaccharide export system permease protein